MLSRLFPSDKCRNCGHTRMCHVIIEDGTTGNRTQRCYPSLGIIPRFIAPNCNCTQYIEPLRGDENGKIKPTSTDNE